MSWAIKTRHWQASAKIQTKNMELNQVADGEDEMSLVYEFGYIIVALEQLVKTTESNRSKMSDCNHDYCNRRGNEHQLETQCVQMCRRNGGYCRLRSRNLASIVS